MAKSHDKSTSRDVIQSTGDDGSNGRPKVGNNDLKELPENMKDVKIESNVEMPKYDEGPTHELKHILSSPRSQTVIQTKPLDFSKTRVSELRVSPVSALDLTSPIRTNNTEAVTAINQTKIKTSPSSGDDPSNHKPVESEESQTVSSYIPILSTGTDQNERSVQQNTGTTNQDGETSTESSPTLPEEDASQIEEAANTHTPSVPLQDVASAKQSKESTSPIDQSTPGSNDTTPYATVPESQPDDNINPSTANKESTTVIHIIDSPEKNRED